MHCSSQQMFEENCLYTDRHYKIIAFNWTCEIFAFHCNALFFATNVWAKLLCPTLLLAIFLKPGESDSICQKLHKIISAAVKFIDLSPIIYDFVPTKSWKKDNDHIFFFQESSLHGVAPLCCSGLALGLDKCKKPSHQNLFSFLSSLSLLPWVWTNVKRLPIKI